ncbi:hypothetical protein [Gemmatimonas sp.]|uniref:hypothetical protein n=1 Tax=Gemmatimonas sp. TaxID=1962908 RepID=UPI003342D91D
MLIADRIRGAQSLQPRVWTLVAKDGDISQLENHLLDPGFSLQAASPPDDFPDFELPELTLYDGTDYYERIWSWDHEMQVLSSITSDVALFDALTPADKNRFCRAMYWYRTALLQVPGEESLATISFAIAVESLIQRGPSDPCASCLRDTSPGPTRRFKQLLDRYSVSPVLGPLQKDIYDARSALVHGRHAPAVDYLFFDSMRHSENHSFLMEIIVKRVLLGWLRDPERDRPAEVADR